MRIETRSVHAGRRQVASGAVAAPIQLSTTFSRDDQGELRGDYIYVRDGNPNRTELEVAITDLEGGAASTAFASGIAALHAVFQALEPGDHVLAPADLYHGTADVLREHMTRWGLEVDFIDIDKSSAVSQAFRPSTRLVLVETPSNPGLRITDIQAVADLCHNHGAMCVVDNTWMTPVLQRPFELGADLVIHACTKYFGGHSDVMGGVVVSREADDFQERISWIQRKAGAVPAPFDCWLIRRGIATLPLRVRAQSKTAESVARFLEGHDGVQRVHYPGLESHPGHGVHRRQADGDGAMLSFQLEGGASKALAVASGVRLFTRATSLGGLESLIEHRASVEGEHSQTPQNLLRVSIGLEHADDLIADLEQALG